jgi:hypothetical protein
MWMLSRGECSDWPHQSKMHGRRWAVRIACSGLVAAGVGMGRRTGNEGGYRAGKYGSHGARRARRARRAGTRDRTLNSRAKTPSLDALVCYSPAACFIHGSLLVLIQLTVLPDGTRRLFSLTVLYGSVRRLNKLPVLSRRTTRATVMWSPYRHCEVIRGNPRQRISA